MDHYIFGTRMGVWCCLYTFSFFFLFLHAACILHFWWESCPHAPTLPAHSPASGGWAPFPTPPLPSPYPTPPHPPSPPSPNYLIPSHTLPLPVPDPHPLPNPTPTIFTRTHFACLQAGKRDCPTHIPRFAPFSADLYACPGLPRTDRWDRLGTVGQWDKVGWVGFGWFRFAAFFFTAVVFLILSLSLSHLST